MQLEIYQLPTIKLMGGSTGTHKFNLMNEAGTHAFNAEGATINFAVTRQGNQNGTPSISKTATLEADTSGVYSIAVIDFVSADTLNLEGKFIYQITIKDIDEKADIPYLGIMYIINNINKSFLA